MSRIIRPIVPWIQIAYILATLFWILLFFWLQTYFPYRCWISWIFLFIPLFVFAINYLHLSWSDLGIIDYMFQGNFLSFGFLIAVILINWNSPFSPQDKIHFFRILLIAFILLMLSLIDIWISDVFIFFHYHIRSILQTMALTLLAYSLYLYYCEISDF